MPCLLVLLTVAFPRIAIILLWLFTSFFAAFYRDWLIPALGFLFLPLTLIVYTYLRNIHASTNSTQSLLFLFIAVVLDLGLVGGNRWGRSRGV